MLLTPARQACRQRTHKGRKQDWGAESLENRKQTLDPARPRNPHAPSNVSRQSQARRQPKLQPLSLELRA